LPEQGFSREDGLLVEQPTVEKRN